ALAEALAWAGHEVTVFFTTAPQHLVGNLQEWKRRYSEKGIRIVPLTARALQGIEGIEPKAKSYGVYEWLRRQPTFDVVHFPEMLGLGYYSLLAKKQGLDFAHTTLCVGLHGPTRWHLEGNLQPLTELTVLAIDFLERRSVELAD